MTLRPIFFDVEGTLRHALAVAAEAEVEAGFHDVFGFIDVVDESQPIVLDESEVAISEVV
jgi:hypothetical protein